MKIAPEALARLAEAYAKAFPPQPMNIPQIPPPLPESLGMYRFEPTPKWLEDWRRKRIAGILGI